MLHFDRLAAQTLETAAGGEAAMEAWTLFPLHGISAEGACLCARPACRAVGKHPAIKWGPEDYPNGTKMLVRPDGKGVGVGLATGSRSGGIVVIDIDTKGGGFDSIETLEATLGRLPETLSVRSPSGGLHLYFQHPGKFQTNASKVAPGIDIKGEGGYAVIPGSPHKAGGHYVVEDARPIATLPPAWASHLPLADSHGPRPAITPTHTIVDLPTLRERLRAAVARRQGPAWQAWRSAVVGERMIRVEGMPESDVPLILGVDEFLTKSMIWGLVTLDDWHTIPGQSMARLVAPSLSRFRLDIQDLGQQSKWTEDHFADRWNAAAAKAAGAQAEKEDYLAHLSKAVAEAAAAALPYVCQLGNGFFILDDRDAEAPRYVGPQVPSVAVLMARQLWGGRRPLDRETKAGLVEYDHKELARCYGRAVDRAIIDYTATRPSVEDLILVQGSTETFVLPEPREDTGVARWIHYLDPTGGLLDWIAWAARARCHVTVPALILVGAPHVGKSLLAAGLAAAAGQGAPTPLRRAMSRFAGDVLGAGPILFGDEGIPRADSGQPMTEEFRALVTATEHRAEVKGMSKSLIIRGGVRVVLAANRLDRLFSNRGTLNSDDMAALIRRLYVVELYDPAAAEMARGAAIGLGAHEGDPARLARVAGHLRWIQATRDCPEPAPRAGQAERELRAGDDRARAAMAVVEDRIDTVDWIARDGDTLWIRPEQWALASGLPPGVMMRIVSGYVSKPSTKFRAHPVTRQHTPGRPRWAGLDMALLLKDGFDLAPGQE